MSWFFAKMQAYGNDFVVLTRDHLLLPWSSADIAQFADRHYGIGCDQLLVIAPSTDPSFDWDYAVYNADGSSAGHCVNGARCVAYWVYLSDQEKRPHWSFRIGQTAFSAYVEHDRLPLVSMTMPKPSFNPVFGLEFLGSAQQRYDVATPWGCVGLTFVSLGNHHALIYLGAQERDVRALLDWVCDAWPSIEEVLNISFIRYQASDHIAVETYERGVGWTLSCGSASFAAALTMPFFCHEVTYPMTISTPGGDLFVNKEATAEGSRAVLSGEAHLVYTGQWHGG